MAKKAYLQGIQWHEGMLLLPQHFQQADLRQERLLHFHLSHSAPYAWGVSRLEIDKVLLVEGMFRVLNTEGVFPDGLAFQLERSSGTPLEVNLQTSLEEIVDDSSKSLTVFLNVPVYAPGMSRSDVEFPRFASASSETVVDENTGEGDVDVPRLQPNLSLYVGETLPSQYVGFPIAKVGYESNAYVLRPFEVPSLLLSREGVVFRRVLNLVQRARQKLSFLTERLNSKSQRGLMSSETEDAVRLLSSGLVPLETLLQAPHIIPFNLYTWLSAFAGQSSALQTGQVPPNFPVYNHGNILHSFEAVVDFIESMLDRIQEGYAVVPFEVEGREFRLNLKKDWIGQRLILGVKAPAGLALEDLSNWTLQAVIASQEVVTSVRDRRVRGAKRRLVEGDSALKLMPAKGMVLAEVTVDESVIKADQPLHILNIEDETATRPVEIVLYIPRTVEG
ncbi:MAG: type VI secretion system baseplate subunit TssK [bacterium]|nr:type VI secretion system baseplate subunit TssK [bacterium]